MKILHICTSFNGGAGLCAKRIMNATAAHGAEVRALVMYGDRTENVELVTASFPGNGIALLRKAKIFIAMLGLYPERARLEKRLLRESARGRKVGTVTLPVTDYTDIADHEWVAWADIIHLHWLGGFIDYRSFFEKLKKPTVWTIHDENPGLGMFHYSMWKDRSSTNLQAMDDEMMRVKQKAYSHAKNLHLVAISSMMEGYFRSNELLRSFPITKIHNGIDASQFVAIDIVVARKSLGIAEGKRVFLFSAHDIYEDRKGLVELIEALDCTDGDNLLICLGDSHGRMPETKKTEVRCEGFLSNSRLLSLYYSAADFFMMPSYQEAFAQTPMEAMACGTPVVAFPCSGSRDLINEDSGIVCNDFTVDALHSAIRKAIATDYNAQRIRQYVTDNFSYDKIAQQYIELYRSVLRERR